MLALKITLYVLSALAGLAIGSFLNVVIYRLPKGTFFSKARSFCPNCGAPIKAYDNIPVLSYIILRGKCRNCHEPISPRYPVIEALNCILWVVNFAVFGISWMTIIYDILVSVCIVVAMIDFDTFEIPDSSNITILLLGLITFFPISGVSWQSKLIGCVCISVPLFIVALFGGMGLGDVKLFFVLGLLFGWQKILVLFLISVIVGAICSVIYMVIRKKKDSGENSEDSTGDGVEAENADAQEEDAANALNLDNSQETGSDAPESSKSDAQKEDAAIVADASENTTEDKNDEPEEEEDDIPKGKAIPFGPFIALATLITVYLGDLIIKGYTNLIF